MIENSVKFRTHKEYYYTIKQRVRSQLMHLYIGSNHNYTQHTDLRVFESMSNRFLIENIVERAPHDKTPNQTQFRDKTQF